MGPSTSASVPAPNLPACRVMISLMRHALTMPPVLISTCSILLLLGLLEASIATDQATAASQAVQSGTPAIQFVSPSSGQTLTTDDVALTFAVEDFTVDCAQSGRPEQVGVGHIHVMLDGLLVNLGCQDTFSISGYGLEPGTHRLVALLADNRHHNLATSNEITIGFRPNHPQPLPRDVALGVPGAQLVSPQDGATVPVKFAVVVNAINFVPIGDLSGKPNVA